MLFTLQQFYRQQEIEYLRQNGRAMSNVLIGLFTDGTEVALIESQANTFAFLTQTRIEIYLANGDLIVDSGGPGERNGVATLVLQVVSGDVKQEFTQNLQSDGGVFQAEILLDDGVQSIRSQASVSGSAALKEEFFTPLNLLATSLRDPADSELRSEQIVRVPIEFEPGHEIGYLVLSKGPAYGRSIIKSVAWGLMLAGAIATVLTSLFGWWLSGRLVQPLDELATVSQQMGHGDLSVRSKIEREDEIGRVAASFNQMAEQVNGTVLSLRRFVADAAHEINTPITALKGNLELLESGISDEQSHLLNQALDQTDRIQTLSADLLQLSELDGAVPIEKGKLDFVQLIEGQAERIAAEAEQAGIEFSQQLLSMPIWIEGHAPSLLSLYQNLIDNALKFTPAEGKIEVALRSDAESAILTVSDNGIGLNGDTELIFGRFYRSPKAAPYPGNGLGLAIGAKIAEQHGGILTAVSKDGLTTFVFALPLAL
ncbi:MAG: ATP-binding protein [Anaerolineae bacterium]